MFILAVFFLFQNFMIFMFVGFCLLSSKRSNSSVEELARAVVEKKTIPDIVGNWHFVFPVIFIEVFEK